MIPTAESIRRSFVAVDYLPNRQALVGSLYNA